MSGVGTEISKLIPEWAIKQGSGCSCKSVSAKWDKYGIAWCERNRERIVDHLMGQSQHLIAVLKMVPKAMQRVTVGMAVDKAIGNARSRANT